MLMKLQQVSRLLAVIYIVSALNEKFSLSSFNKELDENFWASYFHQASIGTHLGYQFFSNLSGRCKVVQPLIDAEVCLMLNFREISEIIVGPFPNN